MTIPFISTALAAPSVTPIGSINLGASYHDILGDFFNNFIDKLLFVAGAAAVIYLVWAGIQYISSAGNPEKVKMARSALINAIIGIAIIGGAYSIINFAVNSGNLIASGSPFPTDTPATGSTPTPCPSGTIRGSDGTCYPNL